MDFWGAVRTLRRRWYIAVPSALVAVAVAAGIFVSIPTRYQSSGVMVLTTPAAGGTFSQKVTPEEAVKINPLLAFDGSLATTSQILSQILADPKTREKLGIVKGSPLNYTATGGGQNGPFLFVTADSDTPEAAEKMVSTVLEFATKELEDQQRKLKAPESTFITSQVIVNPTEAEAQIGGKVRYGGAAFVLLMLLTTAATFGSDSVLNHLRRRREAAARAAGGDDGDDAPPADSSGGKGGQSGGVPAPVAPAGPAAPPAQPAPAGSAGQAGPVPAPGATGPAAPGPAPTGGQQRSVNGQQQGAPTAGQPVPNAAQRRPPGPPARRPTASEQTVKVQAPKAQPTASEKTVKIAVPPPTPAWPTNDDGS
ncbi:hypothetical protein [Saccharothrix sp.]|uniref:hypothetical protein n=1 Tax=Saccharothrix sp. TaxID=1873460 RepID=UPI002811FC46|nr:hypothetical protein [Saccharothrix sp.]